MALVVWLRGIDCLFLRLGLGCVSLCSKVAGGGVAETAFIVRRCAGAGCGSFRTGEANGEGWPLVNRRSEAESSEGKQADHRGAEEKRGLCCLRNVVHLELDSQA